MRRSGASFDPAATLRKFAETGGVLDGLLARVGRRWQALEEQHPSPAELALLQRDLEAATDQLSSLWTLLGGAYPGGGHGPRTPAVLPIPWDTGQGPAEGEPREGRPAEAEPAGVPGESGSAGPRPAGQRAEAGGADMVQEAAAVGEDRPDTGPAAAEGDGSGGRASRKDGPPAPDFPLYRDPEVGVLTREGFDALASGELKRSRRHGRPFTLLLFRAPALRGEELRGAAATVRRDLREFDLLGRHAPELLAVGLPETPGEGGRIVARRVGAILAARREPWDDASLPGIASHPEDGESLLGLLETARRRLGEGPPGERTPEASGRNHS